MTPPILDHLEKLAREATPGPWVEGEWTIFDEDRDAQKRKEPYWTLVKARMYSVIAQGPIGKKALNTDAIIEGTGYECDGLNLTDSDALYLETFHPATILTLIKVIRLQRKALEEYANCDDDPGTAPITLAATEALEESDKLLEGIEP